jgi:hypothetical protein
VLEDDVHEDGGGTLCEAGWYSTIACETVEPPVNLAEGIYTFSYEQGFDDRIVRFDFNQGTLPLEMEFPYTITEAPAPGDTLYLWWSDEDFGLNPTYEELTESSGTIAITRDDSGAFRWGICSVLGSETVMTSGVVEVACDMVETGTPFEGYMAWPYLDFGLLGQDKELEGFDAVIDGTFRVSFGYSQRDFSLATDAYALAGDTLTGDMIPMPLTAPSFQMRITFDASQAWEWFASNMYIL